MVVWKTNPRNFNQHIYEVTYDTVSYLLNSAMWHCVVKWLVPNIMRTILPWTLQTLKVKTTCSFEMMGKHWHSHHIPEVLHLCFSGETRVCYAKWQGLYGHNLIYMSQKAVILLQVVLSVFSSHQLQTKLLQFLTEDSNQSSKCAQYSFSGLYCFQTSLSSAYLPLNC